MEWMVAPSYANATILKVDEEMRKALIEQTCDRCGGAGYYALGTHNGMPVLSPHDGGVCYECGGSGKIRKMVKAYTAEEYNKYVQAQTRAKERKEEKRAAEAAKREAESETNKRAWLAENGFDPENPQVYMVDGGNTYAIKDELKECGCRFDKVLGWYSASSLENLPEDFYEVVVAWDDVFEWNAQRCRASVKYKAVEVVKRAKEAARPESLSEYVGEIKERLRDISVVYESRHTFEGFYGTSTVYTFKLDENVLTWFTSGKGVPAGIEIGDFVLLTGTVKEHKEYNGVKQTILSRCVIKKEG